MAESVRVVVCGAGIAGVATAFHLTRLGLGEVLLVDPLPPLTLTSDKSTECYRNWWPHRSMVDLMNRSIDLLEEYAVESEDSFAMTRRGYLFVTADRTVHEEMTAAATATSSLGGGELRVHGSSDLASYPPLGADGIGGADLLVGPGAVQAAFSYVTPSAIGALHVRRAGWLSAQQLGAWLLDQARSQGAELRRGRITAVEVDEGRVSAVTIDSGERVTTSAFVDAAGPMIAEVGAMAGVTVPVDCEVHQKVAFRDVSEAFPRSAPMLIWSDPQRIDWSGEERVLLEADGRHDLLGSLPRFCHGRPDGGADSPWALGLWEWRRRVQRPTWPLSEDPLYPELVIRGLATMIPGLTRYREAMPQTTVDGGYYTKTVENRPLAGPAGPDGFYLCGALSGFGIMAACAVGELTARHVAGLPLPGYADALLLSRYEDAAYRASLSSSGEGGQL